MVNEGPRRAREEAGVQPGTLSEILRDLAAAPAVGSWHERLWPGAVVDERFELEQEIGHGGFGVVYEATDRELGRQVAFKAVRPGNRSQLGEEWLHREAEIAARLHHPNIVTIHDVGRGPSGLYLILELLEGETLQRRLERGALPVADALHVAAEVARGLAHAHDASVVHRDLKPSNVFLTHDGGVKILDFGFARMFGGGAGPGGGTPEYMAPEQWRDEAGDERVDVFALGAILWEEIEGTRPFDVKDGKSTVLDAGPAPPIARPGVPPAVSRLVAAMLSKDPGKRPRDGEAALARIVEVQEALDAARRARARRRRRARVLLGLAAAAAVAIAIAVWRAPDASERITVAVSEITNETGEPDLDGLSGMLVTSLEQSSRLVVLTPGQMLDAAAEIAGDRPARLAAPLVREIARRKHAAVVEPTLRRLGSRYTLDVHVTDPESGEHLATAREQADAKELIPDMLDRVSERIRVELREGRAAIEASRVRLRDAVTANIAAYDHFSRGERLFELQQASPTPAWSAAREEWRRAIALAPDFARAYYRIAYTLEHEGLDARSAIAAAKANQERAAPKERAYIRALASRIDGRVEEAVRTYRAIVESYPLEKEAWFALAQLSARRESGYDHLHAVEYASKALALAPTYAPAWEQLLVSHFALGDDGALLADAERYAKLVTSVSAWEMLGHAQLVVERRADAEATFGRLVQVMTGSPAGLLGTGMARLQALDLAGAAEAYAELARAKDLTRAREGYYGLSWVSVLAGRYHEASDRLEPVLRIDERLGDHADTTRAWGQRILWRTLADGTFPEDAVRRTLAGIDPRAEPFVDHRHFYWLAAYAALTSGRLDRATAISDAGAPFGRNHQDRLVRMARARAEGRPDEVHALARQVFSPRDMTEGRQAALAEWALDEGRFDEAIAQATEFLSMPIFPPHQDVAGFRAAVWPRTLLVRARAHAAKGDLDAAREDLSRLLVLWREADRDAPDVARAMKLWKQIGGGTLPR